MFPETLVTLISTFERSRSCARSRFPNIAIISKPSAQQRILSLLFPTFISPLQVAEFEQPCSQGSFHCLLDASAALPLFKNLSPFDQFCPWLLPWKVLI